MPKPFDDHLADRLRDRFDPLSETVDGLDEAAAHIPAQSKGTRRAALGVGSLGLAAAVVVAVWVFANPRLPQGPAGPAVSTSSQPTFGSSRAPDDTGILLMRTESGPFDAESERTLTGHPNFIAFTDGVIAVLDTRLPVDEPAKYLSLRLDEAGWSELSATIAAADLPSSKIDDKAGSSCFDGTTALYLVRSEAWGLTEFEAPCLLTIDDLATPDPAVYGRGLVALDGLLHRLAGEVLERGVEWRGNVPSVKIAPGIGG